VADTGLIVAGVAASAAVGSYLVYQLGLKYLRRQGNLSSRQLHDLQAPEWGKPEAAESGDSWTVTLPLLSDTPLDSVRLAVLVDHGQTAGLRLLGGAEGAPTGLDMGEAATWRLRVDPDGDPTTRARVTAYAGNHEWSVLIDLPFSTHNWHDVTIL
jgi:hypothetical protein